MATKNAYPSDDEIVKGVVDDGSVAALARKLGIVPRSLRDYIVARGLQTAVAEALAAAARERSEFAREAAEQAAEDLARAEADAEEALEDEQPSEEEVLRDKLGEAEREAKRFKREAVLEERIVQRLLDHIPVARTSYVAPKIDPSDGYDEHEFVLLFSDTHAAEVVEPEAVLGMNEYNWDVMVARMAKIQRSVISYQRNRPYPIRKLWIGELGDMFSGDIHEELQITNDRTIDEAVVDFSHDFAEFLLAFKPYFEEIEIVCVPGNHPRRSQKPMAKLQQANADWLHYNFTAALLRDDEQFVFNHPRSHFADALICGRHRMLFMHGDGIRSTMPGVPWGGVVRRVTTLQSQFAKAGQPIDYVAMGHFHTANSIEGVGIRTFVNGSVKGADEYSLQRFGHGQDPSQLLLTFHPENGLTDTSHIDLAPRQKNA